MSKETHRVGLNRGVARNRIETAGEQDVANKFPTEHRKGLLPEQYFRWRGGEITRLEAFCDVVFGFAITLLVVSLEVPHTYAELMADVSGFLPFAICFAQLVMIWRAHYRFSRRYGLEDPYTVFLNVVLLFVVLFYVYPLKFVFTMLMAEVTGGAAPADLGGHEASVLMRIYGAGFAAVFFLILLMYLHAYRLRRELQLNPLEVLQTRVEIQENGVLLFFGMASFAMAFRSPALAGWFYFLLGPALGVHGAIFGKQTRLLAEKLGLD
ncbi:MAG TPA: TMEM175 family protein [Candidatus Sulfotelmatobacter sp.]